MICATSIAAVTRLHVADDLVTAVLTEVDVEIRHRHALGIEEALEQEPETHGVEIGDGEGVGDERACARAASRADRDALRLGPLDEVGDDEEVARILHAFDHLELEGQALAIVLDRPPGCHAVAADPALEPGLGALAQLRRLVDGRALAADREARQDRRLHPRPEGAALRDLDRRGDRLGKVGEQLGHFRAGLEPVLGGELAPVGLDHQPSFGDADQRVMRFVVFPARKQWFVGGDERNPPRIGQFDERRLGAALRGRAVPLQLDIEPIAEQLQQALAAPVRQIALAREERRIERPAGTAGERDQAVALAFEPGELEVGLLVWRGFEKRPRVEAHQAAVAALARGQENNARALRRRAGADARTGILIGKIDRQRTADDRLDAGPRHLVGEFERPEHVVGVGERECRLPVRLGEFGQPRNRQRALEQGVGRVHMQVDETRHSTLTNSRCRANVGARCGRCPLRAPSGTTG